MDNVRKDLERFFNDVIPVPVSFASEEGFGKMEENKPVYKNVDRKILVYIHIRAKTQTSYEDTPLAFSKACGMSPNTLKQTLIELHNLNIITYKPTQITGGHKFLIVLHSPSIMFQKRGDNEYL